jgi:hypothetical protein
MKVVVVRSNYPGCEPVCPHWISAEGTITEKSPAIFRKALAKLGKLSLPVVISSPGGDVEAAMAIGDMIRARGLDVSVGWTYFSGCAPTAKDCRLPKSTKGTYSGLAMGWNGYCMSACNFILAAGKKRTLAIGGHVGVHQMSRTITEERVYYKEYYKLVKGKKKIVSRKIVSRKPTKQYTSTKLSKSRTKKIAAYLDRMGVDGKTLLALFDTAKPNEIHILLKQEAAETRIVTDFVTVMDLVPAASCKATPRPVNCIEATASSMVRQ